MSVNVNLGLLLVGVLALAVLAFGVGLLLSSPKAWRRHEAIRRAVARRLTGRLDKLAKVSRAVRLFVVTKNRAGAYEIFIEDTDNQAIEVIAGAAVERLRTLELFNKRRTEGETCARWEDGTRTEVWRTFAWNLGDEHADGACDAVDAYLFSVGQSPKALHAPAPNHR